MLTQRQPTLPAECDRFILEDASGLRPGMPRGPAGAAGLQTIHTKLPYITPSMTISSNK